MLRSNPVQHPFKVRRWALSSIVNIIPSSVDIVQVKYYASNINSQNSRELTNLPKKIQSIEEQIRKLGKSLMKHWGDYANDPHIFDVIEQLAPLVEQRINDLNLNHNQSTNTNSGNVNE